MPVYQVHINTTTKCLVRLWQHLKNQEVSSQFRFRPFLLACQCPSYVRFWVPYSGNRQTLTNRNQCHLWEDCRRWNCRLKVNCRALRLVKISNTNKRENAWNFFATISAFYISRKWNQFFFLFYLIFILDRLLLIEEKF